MARWIEAVRERHRQHRRHWHVKGIGDAVTPVLLLISEFRHG
jgi:hypothetical protein